VSQELRERIQASEARKVFQQTQVNDEDLRSQFSSIVKEERDRKVCTCVCIVYACQVCFPGVCVCVPREYMCVCVCVWMGIYV